MISIQSTLLIALGFLCASFAVLLIAPAFWRRAVRLTTRQLKESMPLTEAEIRADKDRIRVEYAMQVHRLEKRVKDNKLANSRRLIEINRRDASISALEMDLERSKASLEENQNARRVLEQTVVDRLPKIEQRLAEAKRLLFNRDREIDELKKNVRRHQAAIVEAKSINEQQAAQVERLNMSLATRAAKRSPRGQEAGFEVELALRSELEAMRAKTRNQANLISALQAQIGMGSKRGDVGEQTQSGPRTTAQAVAANDLAGEGADMSSLKRSLVDAQEALRFASEGTSGDEKLAEADARARKLKTKIQDQTGEIARLKAALATFEGAPDNKGTTSIRDSKIALKARLNAVQVQAEQQSHVIQGLRAELAAAHERTAMQAQYFTTELRRLGTGSLPAAATPRKGRAAAAPTSLADRIAQPRPSQKAATKQADAPGGDFAADAIAQAAISPARGEQQESNGRAAAADRSQARAVARKSAEADRAKAGANKRSATIIDHNNGAEQKPETNGSAKKRDDRRRAGSATRSGGSGKSGFLDRLRQASLSSSSSSGQSAGTTKTRDQAETPAGDSAEEKASSKLAPERAQKDGPGSDAARGTGSKVLVKPKLTNGAVDDSRDGKGDGKGDSKGGKGGSKRRSGDASRKRRLLDRITGISKD